MATDALRRRAGDGDPGPPLRLQWRPYRFALPREMVTSQGAWSERQGWLLRLEAADGRLGWGEAAHPPAAEPRSPAATPPPAAARPPGRFRPQAGSAAGTGASGVDGPKVPHQPAQPPGDGDNGPAAPRLPTLGPTGITRLTTIDPSLLPSTLERRQLEDRLPALPLSLACALGMALAELDGLGSSRRGGWLMAPPSAVLLPAGDDAIAALDEALAERRVAEGQDHPSGRPVRSPEGGPGTGRGLTVKWKVAACADALERRVLEALLQRLPADGHLRLDANGGWDRRTAERWAERLAEEPRLDWLEQPLHPDDHEGLWALAAQLPVALDESLRDAPAGIAGDWPAVDWPGWLVRRPLLEGDPRPLLTALEAGTPRLMLSTALETGIGRRFLQHLAGLQACGPTPTAPGLAPGWRPLGALFSPEPERAWRAAG